MTDRGSEIEGSNSVPTGSRFETSTDNYCDGFPDLPVPDWLTEATRRMRVLGEVELGVVLVADELATDADLSNGGSVVYERTERGWQATFVDPVRQ